MRARAHVLAAAKPLDDTSLDLDRAIRAACDQCVSKSWFIVEGLDDRNSVLPDASLLQILRAPSLPIYRPASMAGLQLTGCPDRSPARPGEVPFPPAPPIQCAAADADLAFAAARVAMLGPDVLLYGLKTFSPLLPRNIGEAEAALAAGQRAHNAIQALLQVRPALREVWPSDCEGEIFDEQFAKLSRNVGAMLNGSPWPDEFMGPAPSDHIPPTEGPWKERLAELRARKHSGRGSPLEQFIRGPLADAFSDIYRRTAAGAWFVEFASAFFDAICLAVDRSTIDRMSRPTPLKNNRGRKPARSRAAGQKCRR